MSEEVSGGEAGRRVVSLAGGAGVADVVVGPKMNVGVGDGRHGAGPSILWGAYGTTGEYAVGGFGGD